MENKKVSIIDEKLPFGKSLLFALQNLFVMVAGAIAVPIIVGGKAGVDTTFLISCTLLVAGIATIVQTIGIKDFIGARLPVIEATSFASLTSMAVIAETAKAAGDGTVGLREIAGAVICAGLFCFLLAGTWSKLLRFFPHVVTGTVVMVIGISLFPTGINWILTTSDKTLLTSAPVSHLAIAGITLLIILMCNKFLKGVLGNLAILFGLVGGTVAALLHDKIYAAQILSGGSLALFNTKSIIDASTFAVPLPLNYGLPIFNISSIVSMLLVMLVIMTEATGNMIAVSGLAGEKISEKKLSAGLRSSGISSVLSGIFNSYPVTPFAQNVGMLSLTNVFSRFTFATTGIMLAVLAFFPKFAATFASIPSPVLGGASFAMFGIVAVGGIRTLGKTNYEGNKNAIIVAVSLGLSLIPIVAKDFFINLPDFLSGLLHSGITIGCISAIGLNLLFNVLFVPKDKQNTDLK